MRQHLEHLLAALGALGLVVFISYFHTGAVTPLQDAPTATPPLLVVESTTTFPTFGFSTSTLESLFSASPSTSTPSTPPQVATAPTLSTPTPKPVTSLPATSTPPVQDSGSYGKLKSAIVNIICISHDPSLRSVSGTGVIIDSQGLILTVAHVGQVFLLEQHLGSDKISCTIRTGSPAKNAYLAHLIYIPEAWVKENATTLISSHPTGTGEHDYAVLAITSSISGSSLPGSFPALPFSARTQKIGNSVSIGSYGAQELTNSQVKNALYPTLATSTVVDRYTFGTNTVDVLGIGGSAAAQEGSSGGAVIDENKELVGMITTSEVTGDISKREMRVITPTYIERSFESDTGKDFETYFGGTSRTTLVNAYIPTLERLGEYIANAIGASR